MFWKSLFSHLLTFLNWCQNENFFSALSSRSAWSGMFSSSWFWSPTNPWGLRPISSSWTWGASLGSEKTNFLLLDLFLASPTCLSWSSAAQMPWWRCTWEGWDGNDFFQKRFLTYAFFKTDFSNSLIQDIWVMGEAMCKLVPFIGKNFFGVQLFIFCPLLSPRAYCIAYVRPYYTRHHRRKILRGRVYNFKGARGCFLIVPFFLPKLKQCVQPTRSCFMSKGFLKK